MREILFRGKPTKDIHFYELNEHISKDEFVYGNLIVDGDVCYIVKGIVEATDEYINFERWIPVRKETVGQFTGLLDKNGTKIFEGDIIRQLSQDRDGLLYRTAKVVYENDMFVGERLDVIKRDKDQLSKMFYNCEIIGNIHDKGK